MLFRSKIIGLAEPLIKYRQHGNNVVGTVRGSKLSYYKSLFLNVKYYHDADTYIAERHHRVYEAMLNHAFLGEFASLYHIQSIIELFDARSNYRHRRFTVVLNKLSQAYLRGLYKPLNGFWTYLKDVYNLSIIKLFEKRN